jgi:hypothetical protein
VRGFASSRRAPPCWRHGFEGHLTAPLKPCIRFILLVGLIWAKGSSAFWVVFETLYWFTMDRYKYKRNQVEESISHLLEPNSSRPTIGLRTKLKRLLETDRALADSESGNDARFAFFSTEPPGRGVEIQFSSYEAFALLSGLRLMEHGWTQGTAVSIMRPVRPALEAQHERILLHDPNWLFDQEAIRSNAKPGDPAFDNRNPVLLTIVSGFADSSGKQGAPAECKICQGLAAAYAFFHKVSQGRGAFTMFEITTLAHRLASALAKTEPRARGRG